jgi:TLC ATP/ADP transporter
MTCDQSRICDIGRPFVGSVIVYAKSVQLPSVPDILVNVLRIVTVSCGSQTVSEPVPCPAGGVASCAQRHCASSVLATQPADARGLSMDECTPDHTTLQVTWKSKLKQQYPDPNDYSVFMGNFSTSTGFVTFLLMLISRIIIFPKFGWGIAAMVRMPG